MRERGAEQTTWWTSPGSSPCLSSWPKQSHRLCLSMPDRAGNTRMLGSSAPMAVDRDQQKRFRKEGRRPARDHRSVLSATRACGNKGDASN